MVRKRWHCDNCGTGGTTNLEAAVVFHPCRPPRRLRPVWAGYQGTTAEEVRTEAWKALGGSGTPGRAGTGQREGGA